MSDPIAVTGLGALFAGGESPDAFWRTIVSGKDCLTEVPASHWLLSDYHDPDPSRPGKTYARRGAFLGPVPFEPLGHGIPPNMVPSTDTAQLLALIVAERMLATCRGKVFDRVDKDRTSVILGVASATELVSTMAGSLQLPVLAQALREEGFPTEEVNNICGRVERSYVDWTESTFPGLLGNVVSGRVASRFDLGGTNCVVDAACASSLGAVRMAMQELWSGSADMVITGGVDAINDIFMYMCFSKTLAMSRTGDCRPFAANADGTMIGEGLGMFALRRLADAERDGDAIYAVLRGIGSSSDGRAKSIYAPRPAGQAKALRRAYEAAGYSPATVEMLEAHGTGTPAGDAAEVEALRDVFGSAGADLQSCALGSIKSQIGHTKSAAGAASLYKTVMALHHKVLPATIKVQEPNLALGLDKSPFYLNTELRPWVRGKDHPRRASISAFGFGGSNFHLAVEEYQGAQPRPPRIRTLATELFMVSGTTEREVEEKARVLAKAAGAPGGFCRAACESQRVFDATSPVRVAFVAANAAEVAEKTGRLTPGIPGIAYGKGPSPKGAVAFLFPGQGSQYAGMGAALATGFNQAIDIWDRAATLYPALAARVFPPPVFGTEARDAQTAKLTATEVAQPALGVTEWMYTALMDAAGIRPDFCAGHSFGEVSALFAAGVMTPDDFLSIATERGRLMQQAAAEHSGAMLAVVGSAVEIEPLLPEGITIANRNSPQQVVLAGPVSRIDEAASLLSSCGYTTRKLPVATAFHSPIVASAAEPFTRFLGTIPWQTPQVPVFSNATAGLYPADPSEAKALLGGQLARPVRFDEQIEALYRAGARYFVEVGPGSVLTTLTAACLQNREHLAISLDTKGKDAVTSFWTGLAKLAAAGIPFDTEFAWRDYELAAEESKPSALAIPITGTNAGKKYPRAEETPKVRTVSHPAPPPIQQPSQQASLHDERAAAISRIQEQMAESHAATQKALSDSHLAYLRATEAAFGVLSGVNPAFTASPMPDLPEVRTPVVSAVSSSPQTETPKAVVPKPVAPKPGVEPIPAVAANPAADLAELVMGIVAEKTGYPQDILQPEMDLEADLGIDSIKRVQILAAVCEARPDLPQADAKKMATLRTLGAILDFLAAAIPASIVAVSVQPVSTAQGLIGTRDLADLVMGVVAEKTGYPRDILEPEMDLEADLGIDSIKRVQILAAVCEARPDLPQADAKSMATLRTLGAILDFLAASLPAPAGAVSVQAVSAANTGTNTASLTELVMGIVAEKTGYPRDVLQPEMDLEADLGIDSIKRVQILAAVCEARPDLPQADAKSMATLRTLGAILAYLEQTPLEQASHEKVTEHPGIVHVTPPHVSYKEMPRNGNHAGPSQLPAWLSVNGLARLALREIAAVEGDSAPKLGPAKSLLVTGEPSELRTGLIEGLRARDISIATLADEFDGIVFVSGALADGQTLAEKARLAFDAARRSRRGMFAVVCLTNDPLQPALAALAKTLALENPGVTAKVISIEDGEVAQAVNELLRDSPVTEIILRRIGRTTLQEVSRPIGHNPDTALLQGNPVIVVSGGGRGVTASCLKGLAHVAPLRLALLGRSPLVCGNGNTPHDLSTATTEAELKAALIAAARKRGDEIHPKQISKCAREILSSREIIGTLDELRRLGSEAEYFVCDVTDPAEVASALNQIRGRWGAIAGLIHGAGIVADKNIADKSGEQFDRVFATKVVGLTSLLSGLSQDDLRMLLIFSSVAGRYGNAGQVDYAMANATLCRMAHDEAARRGNRCLVRSLGWGPWDGGMVTPDLRAHFERRGIPVIPLEQGVAAFVQELCHHSDDPADVDVVLAARPAHEPESERPAAFR